MRKLSFLLAILLMFAALPIIGGAQAQGPGDFVLGETSVMVPANGEATLSFQTFCLEFGKEFPSTLGTPDNRASDDVLRIVKAAIDNDMADSNPLAVQLAIWSQLENQSLDQLYPNTELEADDEAIALLADAEDTTLSPLASDRGVPLTEAVESGDIVATSSDFRFVDTEQPRPDGEPYHGTGTLTLRNTTDADIEVYYPFGTVFRAANDNEQDIVTYATELEQLPTATPMPTATPAPTPDTVPETGGPGSDGGSSLPWLLFGLGALLLGSASVLMRRHDLA